VVGAGAGWKRKVIAARLPGRHVAHQRRGELSNSAAAAKLLTRDEARRIRQRYRQAALGYRRQHIT
jgi:hypothetical protein